MCWEDVWGRGNLVDDVEIRESLVTSLDLEILGRDNRSQERLIIACSFWFQWLQVSMEFLLSRVQNLCMYIPDLILQQRHLSAIRANLRLSSGHHNVRLLASLRAILSSSSCVGCNVSSVTRTLLEQVLSMGIARRKRAWFSILETFVCRQSCLKVNRQWILDSPLIAYSEYNK